MVLKFNIKKLFIVLLSVLYCLLLFPLVPIYAEDEPVQGCPTEVVTDDYGNEYCMPSTIYNNDLARIDYRRMIRSNIVTEDNLYLLEQAVLSIDNLDEILLEGSLNEKATALANILDYSFNVGTWRANAQGAINCLLGGDYRLNIGCVPQINDFIESTDISNENYYNYYSNTNNTTTNNQVFASGDTNYHTVYNNDNRQFLLMYEQNDVTNYNYYDIDNYTYNFITNTYNYNTTNNYVFAVTNNYNNTVVNVTGVTGLDGSYQYYYRLPDGSNSYNLTEEQIKGYRTDFDIQNYNDIYDYDNLISLFHFDGNKKDSAYIRSSGNGYFNISPNTITYLTSDNYNFGSYLYIGNGENTITINPANGNHFDFRFYPVYTKNFEMNINDVELFKQNDIYVDEVTYETSTSTNNTTSWINITAKSQPSIASVCGSNYLSGSIISNVTTTDGIMNIQYRCTVANSSTTRIPFVNKTTNTVSNELTKSLRFGEWNQLTFLTDSDKVHLYINGVYQGSIPAVKNSNGEYIITINQDGYSYFDELRIKGTSFNNSNPALAFMAADRSYLNNIQQEYVCNNYDLVSQADFSFTYTDSGEFAFGIFTGSGTDYRYYRIASDGDMVNNGQIKGGIPSDSNNVGRIYLDKRNSFGKGVIDNFNLVLGPCIVVNQYNVNTSVSPAGSGTVSGGGTFDEGTSTTLTATPNEGYQFINWSDGSVSNPYNIIVNDNISITANFELIPEVEYTLNVNQVTGGTINIVKNDTNNYTATFEPLDNYTFNYFSLNGINYTSNPFTFSITEDSNLTATVSYEEPEEEQFVLTINQVDSGNINCTKNSSNNYTCSFVPYADYRFNYFVINGTNITSNPFTFDIVQNSTLTVNADYIGSDPIVPIEPPGTGTGPIYDFVPPSLPYDTNLIYVLPKTDTNNKILVQSTIPVSDWQIGGVRPSLYSYGFVYIFVDENGLMKSVQQYDGADWIELKASLYSNYLNKWINYYNYSIYTNNWEYTDVDFIAPNDITNNTSFYEWLGSWFQKIYDAIIDLGRDTLMGSTEDSDNSVNQNNNQNDYLDQTIDDLTFYENIFKTDFDTHVNNIDLNTNDFSSNDNFVNSATFVTGIFNRVIDDNPIGLSLTFVLIVGFAMLLVGRRY